MNNFRAVFRFGWPYIRRYWTRLVCGLVLGILFGLSNGAILGASKHLLNRVFPPKEVAISKEVAETGTIREKLKELADKADQATDRWLPKAGRPIDGVQVVALILLFPALFAARGYIGYLSSYCMGWVSERVVNDLRQDVFKKLATLSLDFYNRSTMGNLITHVHGDTAALHKTLNLGVSDLVKEPVTILVTFFVLLWIDWQLTMFFLFFLPLMVIPMAILGRKTRRNSKKNVTASVSQQSLLVEFLGGIRVVKAYNLEERQTKRFGALAQQLVHAGMKQLQAKEILNPIIETIGALGLGVLIAYIVYSQKSGADFAIFIGAVGTAYTPIKKLAGIHVYFQQASVGVERLMKIFQEQPTVREPVNAQVLGPFQKEVRFDGVSFAYANDLVLQNFNLVIPRGFKLGIAGESGSGKSTIVNLLFRFYDPTAGRISIDGVDIREVTTLNLRSQMALVNQDVVLFEQSIAENIACGKPSATRAEIEEAGKAAYAHDFIMRLPQGYDTPLGDRGLTLSTGQRQRIAIARAFIRRAPILVLDEATAALDAQSEGEVQAAIDHIAEDRTVIAVAHRLSTLSKMDHIIVLKEGKIVESGTFNELVEKRGLFGSMAGRQGFMPVPLS